MWHLGIDKVLHQYSGGWKWHIMALDIFLKVTEYEPYKCTMGPLIMDTLQKFQNMLRV